MRKKERKLKVGFVATYARQEKPLLHLYQAVSLHHASATEWELNGMTNLQIVSAESGRLWVANNNTHAGQCSVYAGEVEDCKGRTLTLKPGTKVCYWRPGSGTKRHWWYDGVVHGVYRVDFPSGQRKVVVGLN